MNIIDAGIHKRFDAVLIEADQDTDVVQSYDKLHGLLDQLGEQIGGHTQLWLDIEAQISTYVICHTYASYRMGLADGMQLQQEVNALMKGGGA